MNTQKECWEAIISGKTLKRVTGGAEVSFNEDGGGVGWSFKNPQDWSIKEEPKMYCRFKRIDESGPIELTFSHYAIGSPLYKHYLAKGWVECTHKTFEEIE